MIHAGHRVRNFSIEYRRVRIKGSASQNEFVSASKGSPHNNDIFTTFFFFFFFLVLHQIDIQEFWGMYICIKTVNVKTNRYGSDVISTTEQTSLVSVKDGFQSQNYISCA